MNVGSERSRSLWAEVKVPQFPQPKSNLKTEILVIGGGMAGLSIAYELAAAGRDIAVVDRGPIGGGTTARTSAHLSYEIDDTYFALIEKHGEQAAKSYFESQKAAVDHIEHICSREKISCDFARLDLFVFAPDRKGRRKLESELAAVHKVGFLGVDWTHAPVQGDTTGCLRFPNQARFHPLRYLAGLARAIARHGGVLYSNTPIVSLEENTRGVIAKTEAGQLIRAKAVVAATNAPVSSRLAVHTKQVPYRTYVLTFEIGEGRVPDCLIWDTEDPYHYVRTYNDGGDTLLIVGGEDHKSGSSNDGADRIKRLEIWAHRRFPSLGPVRQTWSGQIYEPADYLPFIGRSPGHKAVYLVTGDSGEGLTTAVAAALILPELIQGRKHAWASAYRPNRKINMSSVGTYAKDLLGSAKDLVAHVLQKAIDPEDIPRNEGAIVTVDGEKIAAYCDARGRLHMRSAACTHAGCVVQWNSFERCWDCPCHGSQFAPLGDVLQAPALKPLDAKIKTTTRARDRHKPERK